jgi:hypothetical protein
MGEWAFLLRDREKRRRTFQGSAGKAIRVGCLGGAAGGTEVIGGECAAGRGQADRRSRRAVGDKKLDLRRRCGKAKECTQCED